ncbi:FtsB family cell division protein [Roseibacillus ishigakijimensis]|nr:hypothetical protein [Roseibacillus ishigakijimensis]
MAARKKTTARRAGRSKATARKRVPSRQVMEARTQSIAFLNRCALVLLLFLICVAVGVTAYPQWKELQRLEGDLAAVEALEKEALALEDQKERELRALRDDREFQELRGRDLLDLYRPGETVIRIRRD